ncbi:MAG: GHMP family kinase ATP-binding protein [Chloroflexota bacterium]
MNQATVYSPGTCGELVQGLLGDHQFLVSCPVDRCARVTVTLEPDGGEVVSDPAYPKAARALHLGLAHLGLRGVRATLHITSSLPRSKGMGSSTADVVGALFALARAAGRTLAPATVASLALAVEPTNSTLFPRLALFDHRAGQLYEDLGEPVPMAVLVLDSGGEVDTIAYNAVDRTALLRRLAPRAEEALALVRDGVRRADPRLLGRGATLSALAHQEVLPKAQLPQVLEAAAELGALGVCVAHSGSVLGVLFPPERWGDAEGARRLVASASGLSLLGWQRLIAGGCYGQPLEASTLATASET